MRLFTEHDLIRDHPVPLTAPQAHYLRNVMRASPGDNAILFNGRDGEWTARIDALTKNKGALIPSEKRREQIPEIGPWLLFAPIKRGPLDFLVQKSVELGAAALQPVLTDHTNSARIKVDRLRANVIEAAEQCERLTVPTVHDAQKLDVLLDGWPEDRALLVCVERGKAQSMEESLNADSGKAEQAILIGPEGGFSASEIDRLERKSYTRFVSLGPRILRAETAALVALTGWQIAVGNWRDRPA